jgi:uncharacterized protein (UPF0332 family)
MNLRDCLEKGYLKNIKPDIELSNKELIEATYDLDKADQAYRLKDYKWCIVKCYYSMFHAAKALLFKVGYKEKRHISVLIVLEELNKKGRLDSKFVTNFRAAMTAREDADYNYSHSSEIAEYELDTAKEFLEEIKRLLK